MSGMLELNALGPKKEVYPGLRGIRKSRHLACTYVYHVGDSLCITRYQVLVRDWTGPYFGCSILLHKRSGLTIAVGLAVVLGYCCAVGLY